MPPPLAPPRPPRPRPAVLVADDHPDSAETLALLVSMSGYEVCTAHRGTDALAAIAVREPCVVLLDIGLPDLDGYEVAARVHAVHGPARPRLAALTGYGRPDDKRRAREAGFDRHFTKPVDPDELFRWLADVAPCAP